MAIIGTYVDHVLQTPYNSKGDLPMADTVAHYANAAYLFLLRHVDRHFTIYLPNTAKPTMVPFIKDRLDQRRKWQRPKPKREAFTFDMLDEFHQQIKADAKANVSSHLSRKALIFDCMRLGSFTGSRAAEYSQTKGKKGTFNRIPNTFAAHCWRGKPIAFISEDFTYLDADGIVLDHQDLFRDSTPAVQLQLCTRYDKSGRNFAIRKFGRGQGFLCPISASLSLLYRAHLLGAGPDEPISVYHDTTSSTGYQYLRANDVTTQMRQIVIDTYPNPKHFLRLNINRFVSHSNRVTAAISLRHMGLDIDAIAHRLRWQRESVQHYLRESNHDIGNLTKATIGGAILNYY